MLKRRQRLLGATIGGALGVFAWTAFIACGSDNAPHVGLGLDEGCNINSDCTSPYVCAFRKCHVQCQTQRDCEALMQQPIPRCVESDKPFYVCQLPSELHCTLNSQCDGKQVCAQDGQCRDQCANDRDCADGQTCVSLTCVIPTDLDGNGKLPVTAGVSAEGRPCSYNSDCDDPFICRGGKCEYECKTDRDCTSPALCIKNLCTTPMSAIDSGMNGADGTAGDGGDMGDVMTGGDGASDASMLDGGTDSGMTTDGGPVDASNDHLGQTCTTDAQCDDGVWCNGSERCFAGTCAPPPEPECAVMMVSTSCMVPTCIEGHPGSCMYSPAPGQDLDKDGYYAAGSPCVGSMQVDCDDNDNTVYPGAEEVCDEKDNNCNGDVDELRWSIPTSTLTTLSPSTLGLYPIITPDSEGPKAQPNTPAIARLPDGTFDILGAGDTTNATLMAWNVTSQLTFKFMPLATQPNRMCNALGTGRVVMPFATTGGANGSQLFAGVFFASSDPTASCGTNPGDSVNWIDTSATVLTNGDLSMPPAPVQTTLFTTPVKNIDGPWNFYVGSSPATGLWIASQLAYVVAWEDTHLGSTPQVIVGWVDATGKLSGVQQLTTALTDSTAVQAGPGLLPPLLATDGTHIMIAFVHTGGANAVRLFLLRNDVTLGVAAGPVDVANVGMPTSLLYTGSSYLMSGTDGYLPTLVGHVYVTRLDPLTGNTVKQIGFVPPVHTSFLDPRLAAVGRGVMLTYVQGTQLFYGWAPEDLSNAAPDGFSMQSTDLGVPISGAAIAAVDTKHVIATWTDGGMQAGVITCAP
jgi:hypothetical protein